jgi:hypothetical protein
VPAGHSDTLHARDYESAGYCLAGRAYLNLGSEERLIGQGDAWVIPAHASHSWRIVEGPLETVEACSPLEVRSPQRARRGVVGGSQGRLVRVSTLAAGMLGIATPLDPGPPHHSSSTTATRPPHAAPRRRARRGRNSQLLLDR